MPVIQADLADEQYRRAAKRTREQTFSGVEAYLASLVPERGYGALEHLRVTDRASLERHLNEVTHAGPSREWNEQNKQDLIGRIRRRIASVGEDDAQRTSG